MEVAPKDQTQKQKQHIIGIYRDLLGLRASLHPLERLMGWLCATLGPNEQLDVL